MKRIAFITKNPYLYRRAELELGGVAMLTVIDTDFALRRAALLDFDIIIRDTDGFTSPMADNEITVGHTGDEILHLPLPLGALLEAISSSERNAPRLTLRDSERCAVLDGDRIKLTELEYTLLSSLVEGNGDFISREHIKAVLGDKGEGLINVYVHYLREKLEAKGEKVILSSRKNGYAIDKKFLKEDV